MRVALPAALLELRRGEGSAAFSWSNARARFLLLALQLLSSRSSLQRVRSLAPKAFPPTAPRVPAGASSAATMAGGGDL